MKRLRRVRATFDDAFRSAATVFPELEAIGVPIGIFVCTGYASEGAALSLPELEGDEPSQLATMTWDELRGHSGRGVAIGSHGISHAHLTTLSDDEVRRELSDSKRRIEDELGRPCAELAYPYGEHDERIRALVRAAGYERGFGLWERSHDPFALPRLDLYRRHSPVRALLRLGSL